jgi:hypothetical protein
MHLDDGQLRAWLDNEQVHDSPAAIQSHLDACPDCQSRLDALRTRANWIGVNLQILDEDPAAATTSVTHALLRYYDRKHAQQKEVPSMFNRLFRHSYRPAWALILTVLLIAGLLVIPPVRAAAIDFLGLFRVRQIEVVQFNPANLPPQLQSGTLSLERLISDQVQFELDGDPREVDSLTDASRLAGFPVRDLSAGQGQQLITFQPAGRMSLKVDLGLANLVLSELGRSDLQLPHDLDGAEISVAISGIVVTGLGDCSMSIQDPDIPRQSTTQRECVSLVQMKSPVVSAPPGLDVDQVGQVMLQLLGMSPEDAAEFAARVDWASTLILPVPTDVEYSDVTVDGVSGTLLSEGTRRGAYRTHTLIWVKGDILHMLTGQGSAQTLIELANSLR